MLWFARHRKESGAIAVMMALIICFVLIPIAALAVDIGTQRVARRDMQAVADVAALDLGRALGIGQTPTVADAVTSAAGSGGVVGGTQTVSYNSKQVSVPKMAVYLGYIDPNGTTPFVSNQSLGCDGSPYNSYFTSVPSGKTANAVLVTATGSASFHLMSGSGGVCRSAIGNASLKACMTIDSYAAALKSGDSTVLGPIGKLLGTSIDTTVLSSSGILTADLDVLSFLNILKTQLGVGGFDDVLTANVTSAQIIAAEVAALNAQGATVAAQALQSQIGLRLPPGTTFNVGTLLGLTQGVSSGLGATINPLDLASAAVQLANGNTPVHLTASSTNLTGLALDVTIGSKPVLACLGGPTQTMGQTTLTATADLNAGILGSALSGLTTSLNGLLNGVLGLLGAILGGDTYDVPVVSLGKLTAQVSLAAASGKVLGLNCTDGQPTSMSVLEKSTLAPATITIPLIVKETRHYGGIAGIGRKTETATSTLTITLTTTPSIDKSVTDTLAIPGDYDKGKAGPSGDLSVGNLSISTAVSTEGSFSNGNPLVGTLLAGIASVGQSVQANLLTPLTSTVVTPLLDSLTATLKSTLGLTVAGSNFKPQRTASCGSPKLAG
ncbi:MAG: rane protein-like protein [Marmoricola sp.]|nr:rane protein-like protein [Marmoricola sp.]